jgi:hypothetical protein
MKSSTYSLDPHSPTFHYVWEYLSEEIEKERNKNESPNLSEHETTLLRGRLMALKNLKEMLNKARNP